MTTAVPPHAYVVEYRVADRCRVPECVVESRGLHGRAEPDSRPGYVVFGDDKTELFAERGLVLAAHASVDFDLPETANPSTLDLELASVEPRGGPFHVVMTVAQGATSVARHVLEGQSASFAPSQGEGRRGDKGRYFASFRVPLPERAQGPVRVVLRNQGEGPVGLGAPVVRRRVEGRPPRHAIFVIVDAVAYPCLTQLFEPTHDPKSSWLSQWVRSQGVYFPNGISPGQLTGSFVRRFFKADYFRLDGDPSLFGQGFDETPPVRAVGPVIRMAEQGFFTEGIGSNLYLSPILSRIGFDADYNIESTLDLDPHPPILARRFDEALARHAEDDALFVVWYANTHAPWREGRKDAPPLLARELGGAALDRAVLEPMWNNLFESVDSLRQVRDSAIRHAPQAQRLWLLTADHGHTFTEEARERPWRLTRETFGRDHMHCCLATQQEARTPFVILDEASKRGGVEVATPQSSLSAWEAVSLRFDVDLGLPSTSAFSLPRDVAVRLAGDDVARIRLAKPAFDDGMVVSVGNSGALAARSSTFAYRSYQPARALAPAWAVAPSVAHLLAGTPKPRGGVLQEEIYDLSSDPGELSNLAEQQFEPLVAMRRKMTDFLAEYVDTPDHPRYEHGIRLDREGTLEIHAPREFGFARVDDAPVRSEPTARATSMVFRVRDLQDPVGIVELRGEAIGIQRTIRCASSGLPLAVISQAHPRLNLALARTNCVDREPPNEAPPPGEAWFWAVRLDPGGKTGRSTGAAAPELRDALRRWGYVRDK